MALTDLQKKRRKTGLYSSDIARIMSGYAVEVAHEKLGLSNYSDELDDLAEIRLGKHCEPLILDAYDKQFGVKVRRNIDTIMHPKIPWMGVHLDADLPTKNVEAKTAGAYNIHLFGNPGTDQVPDYHLWQAHAGMACTEKMSVDIAVCFLTLNATRSIILKEPPPIHLYTVERDYVLEDALIKKSTYVHDCIEQGITPEPESLSDIKLIYSRADVDKVVQATPEIYGIWLDLQSDSVELAALKIKIDRYKFQLQKFMETAAAMELSQGGRILATWKNDSDGVQFDKEKFEEENPALFNKYLIPKSGVRKFLPKLKEKKNGKR